MRGVGGGVREKGRGSRDEVWGKRVEGGSVPIFSFNLCINCRNVTTFYRLGCRYFATTVPLSQPETARLRLQLKSLVPAGSCSTTLMKRIIYLSSGLI